MDSEKKEINDEACPNTIKPENKKDQNISKINKILSDNTVSEKVFDLLFVIDAMKRKIYPKNFVIYIQNIIFNMDMYFIVIQLILMMIYMK
jgi:hypothetical protein